MFSQDCPKTYIPERLFNSQFSYCLLIWMCHSRTNNRKINRFHERFLRITYNDKQSWFSELLEKDCSVSIRMRNVQYLTTEMFPVSRNIHCVKMSKYGVFSGPYFPAFGLNTERYFVSLRIQSKCGKIRTRKNSVLGYFSYSDIVTHYG